VSYRQLLVLEASLYLVVARLLLWLLPFKRLAWIFRLQPKRVSLSRESRGGLIADVRQAISSAARRLPGDSVCFPRAVAAQAMLRRRGLGTTLYYGAARSPERRLQSHVWLQDGEQGIVGHEQAGEYWVVGRFQPPTLVLSRHD
jgi:hypothetical protein